MFQALFSPALLALAALLPLAGSPELERPVAPDAPAAEASAERGVIQARSTVYWTVVLQAGRTSTIVVDGDGDTDLDVYLYDQNGNLIDADTDTSDYCVVRSTPAWTGPFVVKIVNLGSVWNAYSLEVM